MVCADWKFIILANLLISSLGSPKCRFEFPKLNDSSRLTSDGRHTIVVEFRAHPSCNASSDNLAYSVSKEVNGNAEQLCLILPARVKCMGKCTCPTEGSDLYRLELAADPVNNGTWTWSTIPSSVMEEHSMQIMIKDDEHSTVPKTGSTPTSGGERTPVDDTNTQGHAVDTFVTNLKHPNAADSNTTTATVATCFTIITAVIVTIALIVVSRYKIKVTVRKRLAPQNDLALQEIQDRNQQPPLTPPAQPQQQRRMPEIPGQYQVPSSVPASSGLDARRSVGRGSHVYEVVGGDQEGEVPEVLITELAGKNLHPGPAAQEMTTSQASKPGFGNGLYLHIHPNE